MLKLSVIGGALAGASIALVASLANAISSLMFWQSTFGLDPATLIAPPFVGGLGGAGAGLAFGVAAAFGLWLYGLWRPITLRVITVEPTGERDHAPDGGRPAPV